MDWGCPGFTEANAIRSQMTGAHPRMPPESDRPPIHFTPGLCENCHYARQIGSDRGSVFLMCERSFEDSQFAKYPRLPVLVCIGYRPN